MALTGRKSMSGKIRRVNRQKQVAKDPNTGSTNATNTSVQTGSIVRLDGSNSTGNSISPVELVGSYRKLKSHH